MADFLANREIVTTGLLILLRGLPGSGKSKLANRLKSRHSAITTVIRLDDHLSKWRSGTSLSPDSPMLADAHAACKQAAWSAMQSGVPFVIIDNENLKYTDMLPYVSEALNTNYEVHFIEPDTSWRYSRFAVACGTPPQSRLVRPLRLFQAPTHPHTLACVRAYNHVRVRHALKLVPQHGVIEDAQGLSTSRLY
ncbi:NEDD4-binding protein 2-like 1 [Taenia solium]|eukprot:TsM_001044800 transcript=TsM_001044800 gene=TsM_001044800